MPKRLLTLLLLLSTAFPAHADDADLHEMELKAAKLELAARQLQARARQMMLQADNHMVEAQALKVKIAQARLKKSQGSTTSPVSKPKPKPKPKPEPKPKPKPKPKPSWHTPKMVRTQGPGKWTSKGNALSGTCPAGGAHSIIQYGNPLWQDYAVEFHLRLKKGQIGVYVRGGAAGAQFPSLLKLMKIVKIDPGHWYAVQVVCSRGAVRVRVIGKDKKVRQRISANPRYTNGLFGFVMHAGCEFDLKNLRVAVQKSRPLY